MSNFIPKQYSKEPITLRIETDKLELIEKMANKYNQALESRTQYGL